MNKLLIVVGIVFLICVIVGFVRGFIKIVASLAATIAIIILVAFLTPYVSGVMLKVLPIEELVQDKCIEILSGGETTEEIAGEEIAGEEVELGDVELSREEQISVIENAGLPELFQNLLLENNNNEIYESLGVVSFGEYVGSYLAKLIADIAGFLVTFLVVTIIVRTILYTLGIISDLPVIGGVNRIAGGVLGLGTGLVIVWVLFLVITLLYDTGIGAYCLACIKENEILSVLYESNILLDYVTKIR